jgi:2,3-diaminopropionate biosynthesis protein SbnB
MQMITGPVVADIINNHSNEIINIIASAYRAHSHDMTVNPNSLFLRFPNSPNRIIALPAAILDNDKIVSGIKWISSFPSNIESGIPRASAIIIMNDSRTGRPKCILEGATVSSARTAASAVLAAKHLRRNKQSLRIHHLSVVGCGLISQSILRCFQALDWMFDRITLHDVNPSSAVGLLALTKKLDFYDAITVGSLNDALSADIVVFATNASVPYLPEGFIFAPEQLVLNISLRDLQASQVLAAQNVVDDVDHCLRENTSPHLAEKEAGHRRFISGTLADVMDGRVTLTDTQPIIFSPFGLGVLDVALANFVFDKAVSLNEAIELSNFFGSQTRWTD